MATSEPYQDDDERMGAYLQGAMSPLAAMGINPDEARANPQAALARVAPPATPQWHPPMAAPSGAPAPAAVAPSTPGQKTWADYARESLGGQEKNLATSQAAVDQLSKMPDPSTITAPLEQKRVGIEQNLAQMTQNPTADDKYKPGIGTRIVRGIEGFGRGGIFGVVDPASVGGTAYGAPNKQYGRDVAAQQQEVGSIDQQIKKAADDYKASSDRVKAVSQETRAQATGLNDMGKVASGQETEENNSKRLDEQANRDAEAQRRDAETQRHNQATEASKQTEDQIRDRDATTREGRLGELYAALAGKEGKQKDSKEGTAEAMVEDHLSKKQEFADKYTRQDDGSYLDPKGNTLSAQQFNDKIEGFRTDLNRRMAPKGYEMDANGDVVKLNKGTAPAPAAKAASAAPPSPKTHVFDPQAWSARNKGGDVNAAIAAAKAQGYQVKQ